MENLHSIAGQYITSDITKSEDLIDIKPTIPLFISGDRTGSEQNISTSNILQSQGGQQHTTQSPSFFSSEIKLGKAMSQSSQNFQNGGEISNIKIEPKLLCSNLPNSSQGITSTILLAATNSQKVLSPQNLITNSQPLSFNSSQIVFSGSGSTSTIPSTIITSTSNATSAGTQTMQVIRPSYDNCISPQQQSGQTFFLTSSGAVISSNQIATRNSVFLQDDVMNIPYTCISTSTSANSTYTVPATSNAQFINLPTLQGGTGAQPQRIIIQTNSPTQNSTQPALASNNGHYLIQVGSNPPVQTLPNNLSVNNKGHIVIKASSTKPRPESNDYLGSPPKDGVFRVVIPEGTTKLPKMNNIVPLPSTGEESIRKHVQINLSNRALQTQNRVSESTPISSPEDKEIVENESFQNSSRKLFECPTCGSKFMKALYLRMHMRSCKKNEVKVERTPLYMCSFCKSTFKSRPQISHHFTKCSQRPVNDNSVNKPAAVQSGDNEDVLIDPSLEAAIQYKCQDCDRTFGKERQYSSHIRRCTKMSVTDMTSGIQQRMEFIEPIRDDDLDGIEDPFADPPPPVAKRGRGGKRGRPPGRFNSHVKVIQKQKKLFDGEMVNPASSSLIVSDNSNLVRSVTGLAHTVQLTVETAIADGHPFPKAMVTNSKGVQGRNRTPHAWSLVCSLCQKMFITKVALANHTITQHGPDLRNERNIRMGQTATSEIVFRCPLCELHYNSNERYIEHLVLQHTAKLQESYTSLQIHAENNAGKFVCSMCSLVLLTRNLLMEHLSLEHLDDLELSTREKSHVDMDSQVLKKVNTVVKRKYVHKKKKILEMGTSSTNTLDIVKKEELTDKDLDENVEMLNEEEANIGNASSLECGFCSEEMESQEQLAQHYISVHGVETDADGNLMDLGIDVDIRIKDTQALLKMADGGSGEQASASLPNKTILIRKKANTNFQCKSCYKVFAKHIMLLNHSRSGSCVGEVDPDDPPGKTKETYFCHEPQCAHLPFHQIKTLFKHLEEQHQMVVRKERKTFKTLPLFYSWLTAEEEKLGCRFIRDNSRIEKNNIKLVQMVCQEFQSARPDPAKESSIPKPSKKRWFIRIQRPTNCYARIHLRLEQNPKTLQFDGETQMIYYPDHIHEDIDKDNITDIKGQEPNRSHIEETDRYAKLVNDSVGGSGTASVPPSNGMSEGELVEKEWPKMVNASQISFNPTTSSTSQHSSLMLSTKDADMVSLGDTQPTTTNAFISHSGINLPMVHQSTHPPAQLQKLEEKDESFQMVYDQSVSMDQSPHPDEMIQEPKPVAARGEYAEEYILPADDSEWTKLFEVLKSRLDNGEIHESDKKEALAIMTYQPLIRMIAIPEQVSIFQRLCSLTNTSIETM